MKCSKCGTEFESRFCPNCGTAAYDLSMLASEDNRTEQPEQAPESSKLITPKNKWFVIAAAALFLILVVVLIVVLTQSLSNKKSSGNKLAQLAGTTTSESNAAPAVSPQTTTTTSSTIGANSSQTVSETSSGTASQSVLGSVFDSILGTSSQTSSDDYALPATSSSDGTASGDNSISSQLKDGMTYQQAKKIIGSEGTPEFSAGNTVIYIWPGKGASGLDLSLTFKDGKLDISSSYGLG